MNVDSDRLRIGLAVRADLLRRQGQWVAGAVWCALALLVPLPRLSHNLAAVSLVKSLSMVADGRLSLQLQPLSATLAARAAAGRAAEARPADARAQYLFGMACLNAADAPTAVTALTRALSLGLDRFQGNQQIGYAYQLAGRPRLAVAAWRASGDLHPALEWGNSLLRPGSAARAREVFQAMIDVGDDVYYRSEGYYRLGLGWAIDGRWDLALVPLEQAHRLRPDHVATLIDLARAIYFTGGDMARAEDLIARAVQIQPANEWVAAVLADLYTALGDTTRATRWRSRLAELHQRND